MACVPDERFDEIMLQTANWKACLLIHRSHGPHRLRGLLKSCKRRFRLTMASQDVRQGDLAQFDALRDAIGAVTLLRQGNASLKICSREHRPDSMLTLLFLEVKASCSVHPSKTGLPSQQQISIAPGVRPARLCMAFSQSTPRAPIHPLLSRGTAVYRA